MGERRVPEGFLWGAATSALQIEGGAEADGRAPSIWDAFAAMPGKIADGSDARVACDHYRLWREDVARLEWLGVDAYRFSTSWPRILPEGRGGVNGKGLDFYDALVDRLLAAKIVPFLTLYHWDLPLALQRAGGWASRDTAEAFVDYAMVVADRLGDRVEHWVTHNEPWCIATLGHELGEHAPGHRDPAEALAVAHHVLLSHGWAVDAIRQAVPNARVGIVLNLTPSYPASGSDADRAAAHQLDGSFNRWYLDPLYRGAYPEDVVADHVRLGHLSAGPLPFVREGDMSAIATPTDFLGVNYYSRAVMRAGADGRAEGVSVVPEDALSDMGWEVYPDGLRALLERVHRDYAPRAIYVTENGVAYADGPDAEGRVADTRRVEYLRAHIDSVERAIEAGVPVKGYFVWSLLDNFEWAHGYEKRFGLFWVDFTTQERIPKDSARWYRETTRERGLAESRQET